MRKIVATFLFLSAGAAWAEDRTAIIGECITAFAAGDPLDVHASAGGEIRGSFSRHAEVVGKHYGRASQSAVCIAGSGLLCCIAGLCGRNDKLFKGHREKLFGV